MLMRDSTRESATRWGAEAGRACTSAVALAKAETEQAKVACPKGAATMKDRPLAAKTVVTGTSGDRLSMQVPSPLLGRDCSTDAAAGTDRADVVAVMASVADTNASTPAREARGATHSAEARDARVSQAAASCTTGPDANPSRKIPTAVVDADDAGRDTMPPAAAHAPLAASAGLAAATEARTAGDMATVAGARACREDSVIWLTSNKAGAAVPLALTSWIARGPEATRAAT